MKSVVTVLLPLIVKLQSTRSQANLSPYGFASQSSTFTWYINGRVVILGAHLAVTGGPTNDFNSESCATTAIGRYRVWWMLTFPTDTVFITNIKIFYRVDTPDRLAGYSLYISNTTLTSGSQKPSDGNLCYHDSGPALPSVNQTIDCNVLGQNIIIYNERHLIGNRPGYSPTAFLELCDVQVNGCYKTFYGEDCSLRCPLKCVEQHCYPGNGSCVWGCNCLRGNCDNATICTEGCAKGYAGQICNQYNLASFGIPTQFSLMSHQKARTVVDGDRTSGSCSRITGPNPWWQMDLRRFSVIKTVYVYLNTRANGTPDEHFVYITNTSGTWRDGTSLNVTANSNSTLLRLVYDIEPSIFGRYVIYVPSASRRPINIDLCEVEIVGCPAGKYGQDCKKTCPENCRGSCHLDTGVCMFGCNHGWITPYCNQSCDPGYFGNECSEICRCSNVNISCYHVDGTCPKGGCQRGYKGLSCSTECSLGQYGFNCNETCEGCIYSQCDTLNGTCIDQSGCKYGWQPILPMCDTVCEDGYYGNCSLQCHCRTGVCEKSSGICTDNQCDKGWTGRTCNKECRPGTYGFNCRNTCNSCLNSTCDRFEGNCTYGCRIGFKGDSCQIGRGKPPLRSSSSVAVTVGGTFVGVTVLVCTLIIVILLRRRYQEKKNIALDKSHLVNQDNKSTSSMGNLHDGYINNGMKTNSTGNISVSSENDTKAQEPKNAQFLSQMTEVDDDAIYNNCVSDESMIKYRIVIDDLQAHIAEKHNKGGFKKEYEILPKGLIRPHVEASKVENKTKNRYLETLPYDHSRIVLKNRKGTSDYINASYIDSYSRKKAYIAAQGPKKPTISDFWQMVWQENVEIIVMVTQLIERGKIKCAQYWPRSISDTLQIDNYKISMIKEKEQTVHVYRQFNVYNKKTELERTVHQFHFTQWPDHDVPDRIKLVSFYRKVKRAHKVSDGPMLVHCSAGVGRTGTFIALNELCEHGQATGNVDILEYVQIMRKDRPNMIQTKNQYTAVFEALLEAFKVPYTAFDKDHFQGFLKNQENNSVSENKYILQQEFQKLEELKPNYTKDSFRAAHAKDNKPKNVDQDILPHDKYRPYLMSYSKSKNDYINAVIIPEHTNKNPFLVTQYPLKETVEDFWTMVYDNESSIIVLLESVNEDIPLWPMKGDVFDYQVFSINQSADSSTNYLNISINHKEKGDSSTVRVITMDDWNADNIPSSTILMKGPLSNIYRWRKNHEGSVTVVCRNGCRRSGLLIALSLVLQKIDMDEEIDIFQIVRAIRIRRPQFLPSFAQYEFCYQYIKEYTTLEPDYENI